MLLIRFVAGIDRLSRQSFIRFILETGLSI